MRKVVLFAIFVAMFMTAIHVSNASGGLHTVTVYYPMFGFGDLEFSYIDENSELQKQTRSIGTGQRTLFIVGNFTSPPILRITSGDSLGLGDDVDFKKYNLELTLNQEMLEKLEKIDSSFGQGSKKYQDGALALEIPFDKMYFKIVPKSESTP